jgi:hypothetical protein
MKYTNHQGWEVEIEPGKPWKWNTTSGLGRFLELKRNGIKFIADITNEILYQDVTTLNTSSPVETCRFCDKPATMFGLTACAAPTATCNSHSFKITTVLKEKRRKGC